MYKNAFLLSLKSLKKKQKTFPRVNHFSLEYDSTSSRTNPHKKAAKLVTNYLKEQMFIKVKQTSIYWLI